MVSPASQRHSITVEEREIRPEEQINRLLTSISSVSIMNKHYTYKDDAHP
jgi:hypothetical protein